MPRFLPLAPEPDVVNVDPRSGHIVRRSGSCNRCGECCRSGDPFNGERGEPAVKGACPLFAWTSVPGVGHCTDREEPYYLNGCRTWPQFPDQVADYPSCSYVFEMVT